MKIIHDCKKLDKFERDSIRNHDLKQKNEHFWMYIQMAETQKNALELAKLPWKWKKIHKLKGDRSNQYSFGISAKDRTICFGNERKNLYLSEVTELEIFKYIEDYH